ncbi:MAG: hypothetical protein GX605_14095 [Chloroflexi bacterium]|nr:hypothetical protein [Chloroflexota bacterium]
MSTLTEQARLRLEDELKTVGSEIEDLNSRLEVKGDYSLGAGDPAIYQWELNLALKTRAEQRRQDIEAALERLAKGTYGICAVCGQPIADERLELLPTTEFCCPCAQKKR